MKQQGYQEALEGLVGLGMPSSILDLAVTGALHLHNMGGPHPAEYWPSTETERTPEVLRKQRAELYLVGSSLFSLLTILKKEPHTDRQLKLDVSFLYFLKGFAQTLIAVDALVGKRCYFDALSLVRSMHGRVHLLALFALDPRLFDDWLKHPADKRFLDGQVRDELANHGIFIFPHLYEEFSEVTHGHHQALAEGGYLERGLFPEINPIANKVMVAQKLLLGAAGWIGYCELTVFPRNGIGDDLERTKTLFDFLAATVLPPNRVTHLFTTIAEERHWEKTGKNRFAAGRWFNFPEVRRQISLFGRERQPKRLGKAYRNPR